MLVQSNLALDLLPYNPGYQKSKPEDTVLYEVIRCNYNTFVDKMESEGNGLPLRVKKEFENYLQCGIPAYGFLRSACESCHKEMILAYSCKGRAFCPSCGGRKMAEISALLLDYVIPNIPIRQWVVTFPFQLRYWMATNPKLTNEVLEIVIRDITGYYIKKARKECGLKDGKTGAITLIQRFGSFANLSTHFHVLFTEGVYDKKGNSFYRASFPSDDEVRKVITRISLRIIRYLNKKGYIDIANESYYTDNKSKLEDDYPEFAGLIGASISNSQSMAKGQRIEKVKKLSLSAKAALPALKSDRCYSINGFSLHANTHVEADQRKQLEKLCRYILRPAISNERLSLDKEGNVIYQLKRPFADGTTAMKFTPLEFMARLAALVPLPRVNLTRYHGIFAPGSSIRDKIVPNKDPESKGNTENNSIATTKANRPYRLSFAQLLKRVFKIDLETCPHCHKGKMRIIAPICRVDVIRKILIHLKIPPDPPLIEPSRYERQYELKFQYC